jgi:hypothetical protein
MAVNRSAERALETVESALGGRIGMVEAAHALLPLLRMNSDFASQDDFDLIRAIESETDDLPIGRRVREHWHPNSLREKDRELVRCEGLWHEQMESACQRIRRMLLVRMLVLNRHLSVAERQLLGPVQKREVASILRSILRGDGVFPAEGREGFAYEGVIIGRVSSGAQITHSRTYADRPQIIAERRVEHYGSLDAAIEAFIDCEWAEGIDGVPIIEPSN